MRNRLDAPKAPNQPYPPVAYAKGFFDALTNALRLYFTRLDLVLSKLLGSSGGRYIEFPFGQFSAMSDRTAAAANTPYLIGLDTVGFANGMYHEPGDGVHVSQGGVYNAQFSIQFKNTDIQIHEVVVWLRKNGTDYPASASTYAVTAQHGGIPGYLIAVANFYMQMDAGDWVELWWSTTSTLVSIHYRPAQTTPYPHPAIPAAVATLAFVSNPPA